MQPIKCFWLQATEYGQRSLRRYCGTEKCSLMDGEFSYHNKSVVIEPKVPVTPTYSGSTIPESFEQDNRWPVACDCGYEFKSDDQRQLSCDTLYQRLGTDELMTLSKASVGALWDAEWYPRKGYDGHAIYCKTPGGDWLIDSRANNCTMPDDDEHRCWVRHGTIGDELHVDKNGNTCRAGAGSIMAGSWHGFLHNGYLTS